MKHRRRNNTQTLIRKSASTKPIFSSPKKKKSKKPLLFFFLLSITVVIVFLYKAELGKLFETFSQPSTVVENSSEGNIQQNSKPAIPADNNKQAQYYSPIEKKIQLEILNGCGESGVAKKLTDLLKKSKYDIVNSGNYIHKGKINWDVNETKIIDQINKQENARELADLMGILYSNVEVYDNPSPISDITIIIGKDYKTLSIFQ